MEWTDDGIVLSARRHGETSAIVTLMTRMRGIHAGLARGGGGKRAQGIYQPGNRVSARWRGRLAEHLGTLTCELTSAAAATLLDDPIRLAGLSSACAVCEKALPEHQPHGPIYEGLNGLLGALVNNGSGNDSWGSAYVKWELGLLGELGFGLDLSCCAATGETENLTHVSPKSGRAVSAAAAAPYRERLLPLPRFLLADGAVGGPIEVADGLKLTGYFLHTHVFAAHGAELPPARKRLADHLRA